MDTVDLFAGLGGMTLGAKLAGARVVHAENHWTWGVDVHRKNHPEAHHLLADVRARDWRDLPPFGLLVAGPACQGHSSNGRPTRKRNPNVRELHDLLRTTADAVVECVRETEPAALVVENVPPFVFWDGFGRWWKGLERAGMELQLFKLWASHHEVPQRRQRLFIVGTRRKRRVNLVERELRSFPETPFGPCIDWSAEGWRPITQAKPDAQARMRRAKSRCGPVCLSQNVTNHPGVPLNEPIRTITTMSHHWALVRGDEYRYLTMRELARGQSFPDTFHWPEDSSTEDVARGLGNAVPPLLARNVIRAVLDAAA